MPERTSKKVRVRATTQRICPVFEVTTLVTAVERIMNPKIAPMRGIPITARERDLSRQDG
jgi:hypothetical protein